MKLVSQVELNSSTNADYTLSINRVGNTLNIKAKDEGVPETLAFDVTTPTRLEFVGDVLSSLAPIGKTDVFGTISKEDLRVGLSLNKVENVAVADMDVSIKTLAELAKKQNVIDSSHKIATSVVDGLDNSIALLATKAELATIAANAGLGIKKEFNSLADMNTFTTSADGDQCAVNESNGKRSVYVWKLLPSPAWSYVFALSDTHNHDDRYFTKTESNTALTAKLDKTSSIPQTQVTGLDTALATKVDSSRVLTQVPAGAVFTDEKWAGEAQMRSDFNNLKAVVDTSSYSDVYRRTVKTFSAVWIEIAPNVKYRIDSSGDGSALKFFGWQKEGKVRIQRSTDFPFADTLRYNTSWLYDDNIESNAYGYITWPRVSNWRDMNGDSHSFVTEYMRVEWERDGNRMTKVIKLEISCNELNDHRRTYTINTTVYGDQFKQA